MKIWSVNCSKLQERLHLDWTELRAKRRMSLEFLWGCCQPTEQENDPDNEPGNKHLRRHHQRKRRREIKKSLRDKKWTSAAKNLGKRRYTTIWTWNVRNIGVSFLRRNRFRAILREVVKSKAEMLLSSEMLEETSGINWAKSKKINGVLVHVFLRDL